MEIKMNGKEKELVNLYIRYTEFMELSTIPTEDLPFYEYLHFTLRK